MIASPATAASAGDTPRWGQHGRDRKGRQIAHVLAASNWLPALPADCVLCDLGCGNGGIAATLGVQYGKVIGVDPEPWTQWDVWRAENPRIEFRVGNYRDAAQMAGSFDVVVCNQVYEHVDDARALIATIHKLLKPGGIAYFAGPNRLYPIEPHVFWPFVHWIPRDFAVALMRAAGSKRILDANSVTWWTLRHWLSAFEHQEGLSALLAHRLGKSLLGWWAARIPRSCIKGLFWAAPGFVLVLRKSPCA